MSKEIADKVSICTTTRYNPDLESDRIRAECAVRTIREATDLGYKLIVVDGGSSDEFLRTIEDYGAKVYAENENSNMGKGRRQSMKLAYETRSPIILWTEPEKDTIPSQIETIVRPLIEGGADLVVPRRRSLESYPTSQQHAEHFGNTFWKELTGTDLDMWIGPRAWNKDLSHYFLDYDGEYGDFWDSIFIPVMDAIHSGERVQSVDIDYTHPAEQTAFEEGGLNFTLKRLGQLDNLFSSLKTHWDKLKATA